ncbi:MAG TPA: LpqB family beta-propeller domain-containing protein, partial [Steroidobacteraceae bacterium]|nr:LpqB family beta-propeller domain-containing protein [Steroidobacteraceae bacterium]
MSRLLDEALPLDADGRRVWLAALPAEQRDLAQSLRDALLPGDVERAQIEKLASLPSLGAASQAEAPPTSGLHTGDRVGPYELIRPLGTGGMAEVWLARRADGAFRREVALKLPMSSCPRPDLEQRFARERDILASLEHPHIARFYDAGVGSGGLPYLSMEYVEGRPLTEWCDAHRLGIRPRLELFLQMLEAVQYAHEKQVIHRDLKPSNVLVTESGQIRLLDFGVARLLQADEPRTELTHVHGRALTPDYASPELLRGESVDARGDVYSLGVLLYELLTGVRPYRLTQAASIGLLEHAIVTVQVKKPSTQLEANAVVSRDTTPEKWARQLRGDLDAIALKALAKEPAGRYPSAAALMEDLRRYLNARPVQALPARLTDRLRKFLRRNRVTVGVTVTAVAIVVAAVTLAVVRQPGQGPSRLWLDPLARARVLRLTDFAGTEQAAAISRDGRFAAFLAARNGPLDLWLTEIGTNHYRNLTEGRISQLRNPEIRSVGFSPDGSLVTFWARNGDGSRAQDINVMAVPTAGGAVQPYLPEAAELDWSADARQVVFHTTAPGDPLFVRAATEAKAHRIYVDAPGVHCHFLTWSPDGEFIYFVRGDPPSADWDIWRLRPSGAGLERLTSQHAWVTYPVLLDARTLLYLATDADGSGPWLYVLDLVSKRSRRVSVGLERYTSLSANADRTRILATVADSRSELWRAAIGNSGSPQATAERIAGVSQSASAPRIGPGYIAYVSSLGARRGIWKYANRTATELWSDATADRVGALSISPDGRRIAFVVDRGGTTQLYAVDSDGRNPRLVAQTLTLRGDLAWAPDSQSILSAIESDGEPRLARIFLDSSPPQPMVSEYSVDPAWSPDGKYFVYSGAQVATIFPLRASAPDGRPYGMPGMILTIGARRVAFARNSG